MTTIAVSVLVSGCGDSGPPRAMVTGTVTYKDEPLPTGTITFVPEQEGTPYGYAEIAEDGTYSAYTPDLGEGIPLGSYRVMISAVKDVGPEMPVEPLIPSKYSSDQQSGLTAEVTEGENVGDFKLTEKPRSRR